MFVLVFVRVILSATVTTRIVTFLRLGILTNLHFPRVHGLHIQVEAEQRILGMLKARVKCQLRPSRLVNYDWNTDDTERLHKTSEMYHEM